MGSHNSNLKSTVICKGPIQGYVFSSKTFSRYVLRNNSSALLKIIGMALQKVLSQINWENIYVVTLQITT